ncbi:MAG: hypothetical protein GY784_10625 [Gammaproteobacteria bacterium]|nr:hypothetical protein [Gammaproteobacteria bacterium]
MKLGNYLLPVVFLSGMQSMPAVADVSDKYSLSVGTSLITFDSYVTLDSHDNSVNEEIDLEDDLGLDSNLQVLWLSGVWRLTGRHRVRATYMPLRRSADETLMSDIDVGDHTIKAGAFVDASFVTEIIDIEYLYSFHKTPEWETSVGVGLYGVRNRTEIIAEGVIIDDIDGSEKYRRNFQTTQSFSVPMPLIGLSTSYELNSNIRFHGSARYLDVEVNGIAGHITSLNLRTDYFFSDHVGAGFSLTSFDLTVNRSGVVLKKIFPGTTRGARFFWWYGISLCFLVVDLTSTFL